MLSNSLMCLRDQLSREIDAAIDGSEMALRVNQRSRSKIAALSHLDLRSELITDKAHVSVGSILSLIPGLGVKLSTIILAGPTVLSAVGFCPSHDGVICPSHDGVR